MTKLDQVQELLQRLNEDANWTFAVGVRIRFANPTLLYQTYPQDWVDFYNDNGLVFVDPAVRWAMANIGICDWSDLAENDTKGCFDHAAAFGLAYGKVIAVGDKQSRTVGFFAQSDRRISDDESRRAQSILQDLHKITEGIEAESAEYLARLRALDLTLNQH